MAQERPADQPRGEPIPERYEEIVQRLGSIVDRLEGGGLSLEDAVTAFEQGIRLARAGGQKLDEAEKRVELLLDGDRTQPFDPAKPESAPRPADARPPRAPPARPRGASSGAPGDDDIPF